MKNHIRKIFCLVMAIVFVIGCIGGCGQATVKNTETVVRELKIGVDILKPFLYKDENGDFAGLDADIIYEVCDRLGYTPVFQEVTWGERDEMLENGDVDCLWTAFAKDGREDKYTWTESYMESDMRVLVDNRNKGGSLSGETGIKSIAVRGGSKAEEILLEDEKYSGINLYSCSTFKLAETAFIKGYADGVTCYELVLDDIMKTYPDTYNLLDDKIATLHLAVAFYSENEIYREVNDTIKEMKNDGTLSKIIAKY